MNRVTLNTSSISRRIENLMWRRGEDSGGTATYDGEYLTVTSPEFIGLHNGDKVYFERKTAQNLIYDFECVVVDVIDRNTSKITVPTRPITKITSMESAVTDDNQVVYLIQFDESHYALPYDFEDNPDYTLNVNDGGELSLDIGELHPLYMNYPQLGVVYAEGSDSGERLNMYGLITEQDISDLLSENEDGIPKYTTLNLGFAENPFFQILNENGDARIWNDVEIYTEKSYANFQVTIGEREETGLQHEELVTDLFVSDVAEKTIPSVLDMEKVVFEPYDFENNEAITAMTIYSRFRDRRNTTREPGYSGEGWTIIEDSGWYNSNPLTDRSDSVKALHFTTEDIYYRKEKVSRSFFRLSFFNSPKIYEQQLLAYSTVFLDSGELYGKLVTPQSASRDPLDEVYTTVNIYDRHNTEHSSEGFYLYLFPSELGDEGETTIYLKIEFNHAGYGKTIPMPRRKAIRPLEELEITPEEFLEYLYIPIKIKFDSEKGKYYYGLAETSQGLCYNSNGHMYINLLEAKLTN